MNFRVFPCAPYVEGPRGSTPDISPPPHVFIIPLPQQIFPYPFLGTYITIHYIHHPCISPADRRQTCVSGAIHGSISMRENCFLPRLQWEHVGKDDTATHLMDFISSTFLPTEWPFLGSISQFSSVNCPVTVFLVSWSRSEVRCNFFSHISHIWFSS